MKNLTQLPWSGKGSKAKNDNTLGRMRGGIRSRIGSMSLKNTSLFGVILTLLLTFGVGEMWGDIAYSGGYIYFDNSLGINSTTLQLCARQSSWTGVSTLSNISNTKLYYVANPQGSGWGGILGWVVISANPAKSNSNFDDWSSYTWCSNWNTYGFNSGSTYLIVPSSTSKSQSVATSYLSSGYSALNSTQTIKSQLSTDGGSTYSDANSKATISITSYAMTGNGAATEKTASISTSAKSTTVSAARTATTTLSIGDVATGYEFVGWYVGSTQKSTSASYTYYPTAATTVVARFKETRYQAKVATITPSAGGSASPTSWTYMGQISGGDITATPNTGYSFSGWSILSGGGGYFGTSGTATTSSTAETKFRPTKSSSLKATFTANSYTFTLNGNGGSDGSVTIKYDSDEPTTISGASRAGYSLNGYYTAASGGNKVINTDGSLNSVSGWVIGGYWKQTDETQVLYAQWTESAVYYTLNFSHGTSSTGHVSVAAKNSSTDAAISSGASLLSGTGVTVTATPASHYKFVGWYSDAACTSLVSSSNPYSFAMSANTSLYAKVELMTTVITLDKNGGSGSTPATLTATHGSSSLSSGYVAPTRTGYTLQGWYTAESGGSRILLKGGTTTSSVSGYLDGSGNWIYTESTLTLYAQWTEQMSTLTTSNSYDVGDPSYAAPTVSGSATNVGYVTTRTITAAAASTGYTFTGWTLTNCTRTDGGAATATSITIRSNGDGAAASVVANYKEDCSSRWHLVGADVASKVTFPHGWNVDAISMMQKATGHSTESVVYANVTVSNAAGTYEFKVVDDNGASSDIWYGYSTGGTYLTWTETSTKNVYTGDGNGNNLKFTPTITGTYLFKVDYSGTYPAVTITYPTPYTVTYSVYPDGAGGAITTSPSVSSGGEIAAGTSVTFTHGDANAGYDWYRWEDGSGSSLGTGSTYTTSITANTTVVAKYRAKTYTITLDKQTSATGYGSSGTAANPTATYNAVLPAISGSMPAGTGSYGFMGFYTGTLGTGLRLTDASGAWIASVEGYTDADKKWIHAEDVTLYAYYKQAEISDLTPDPAIIAPGETVTVTPTLSPAPAGTHIICWELQYSNGTALPSQPTFTPEASNAVSFPAPAASATYRIQATLRSGSSCGGGSVLSTRVATFQVAGEHTVTVLYKCGDLTLAASSEVNARPLEWSDEIVAPDITGYTFSGWEAGDGVTIKDDEDATATTHIKAVYDGTLTANYTKKRLIYFNNTLNWANVYVYFYKNNSYWDDAKGAGTKTTYTYTDTPYGEGLHGEMTQIDGTNIYYFDAEAAGVNSSYTCVAFTEANQHDYEFFYETNVVRRDDYKSTTLPMFVPIAEQTPEKYNNNKTNYYFKGYWMNYPENTGYTLKIYNQKATAGAVELRSVPFAYSADLIMPLEVKVDLEAGRTYGFKIYRADGTTYGNTGTMTANTMNWEMTSDASSNCGLTTTAAGDYTFNLYYSDYNEDRDYQYRVDVTYPVAANDYRIVYSDLAAWSGATHTAAWIHPSRVITKNSGSEAKQDTVSFYWAYGSSPALKYQTCTAVGTGSATWSAGTAISVSSFSSVLTKTGVYNFIFEQPAGGASISLVKVEPYEGKYYIRTDCAGATKWANYRTIDHEMTYSDYAETNSGFSHYFAHWVTSGTNVKFTIANDYSPCVSDTLTADYGTEVANINAGGDLVSGNANIRFMWNQSDNKLSRAYISGSGNIADRFLVLEGDAKMYDENGNALTTAGGGKISGLDDYEMNLIDDENFVYERTIQVNTQARAKLTAKYNSKVQYFIGGAEETVELLGGAESPTKYTMRIVYDFKTNRLVTAYMPSDAAITEDLAINADIMLVREHQNAGQQLTFDGGSLSAVKTVYGVMRFNRWTLNNKSTATGHAPVGDPKSTYERSLYWISFPFDVNLSDVFGFGTYGTHWIIEYYDGAERATEGYWKDSEGFWKYITNRRGVKLEAGKGYILALDLDLMRDNNTSFWSNDIQQVELFFPSAAAVENIEETDTEIDIPAHECTIATRPGMSDDRTKKDSHWNIIGVPSYANYGETLKNGEDETITWNDAPETKDLPFLYEWNTVDNTYSVQSGSTYPFKSMHAYMVQYFGKIKWSLASATPASPVIARQANAPQDVEFRLELQAGEKVADQTFVKMTTDEQISTAFDFNYDLSKQMNSGKANIYTMVEGYIQTAGNCLPMSEQTTVVPVGVKIAADGDYTFAIPEGTEGVGVTLIDQETGIRTSLSALAYTVTLEAGTYDERFVLEISPIHNVPTEQSAVSDQQSDVRKVLIDGLLYIVRDNKMYDARGAMIMEK